MELRYAVGGGDGSRMAEAEGVDGVGEASAGCEADCQGGLDAVILQMRGRGCDFDCVEMALVWVS